MYADLFGPENVLVLPLEELKARGTAAYLGRLCDFLGLPLRPADVARFRRPRNERMTVVEARVADLIAARHEAAGVRRAVGNEHLAGLAGDAARVSVRLGDDVLAEIARAVADGNRWLADAFGLPLAEWGYAVAPPDATGARAAA